MITFQDTYDSRKNEIENFLIENLHFPFNQSDNATENSLYTWWRRIAKSDELSDLRFHQEELFAAWEKAMEEQEQYEQAAGEE